MKSLLIVIFLIAVLVRLFWFPDNVYFAYDQARDAYATLSLVSGDLKIIGPPSAASDKLFPGPLAYYVYAPFYFLDKNPEVLGLFLRIYNALGVFLVFLIASCLFNKKVGFIASLFFAFSYDQTQYSLFLSHQGLATLTVLTFYLGLSFFIFKKKNWGLPIAALGWGLSMQFHYSYLLLLFIVFLMVVIFRKRFLSVPKKTVFLSALVFFMTISTYILAEIKFNFRFLGFLLSKFSSVPDQGGGSFYPSETFFIFKRFFHDTFLANYNLVFIPVILTLLFVLFLFREKKNTDRVLFLILWFLGGFLPYIFSGTPSYYYSASASMSLFILAAYLVFRLFLYKKLLAILLLAGILLNNLILIKADNPHGPNEYFVIQQGMVVVDQKRALDYIYQTASEKDFSVSALTIPFKINTTWSYLFEWYGKEKYGFVPVWGGDSAKGYAGNLEVVNIRSQLPEMQFLIMEPTKGLRGYDIEKFFEEESYFTKVVEEKKFGTITIQKREKI